MSESRKQRKRQRKERIVTYLAQSPSYGSGLVAIDLPIRMLGRASGLGAKSPGDWGRDGRLTLGVLGMYSAQGIGKRGDAGVQIVMGVCAGEGRFS